MDWRLLNIRIIFEIKDSGKRFVEYFDCMESASKYMINNSLVFPVKVEEV